MSQRQGHLGFWRSVLGAALTLLLTANWATAGEEGDVWNIDGRCIQAVVRVYEDFSQLVKRHQHSPTPELKLLADPHNYVWRVSRTGSTCTVVITPDFGRMPMVKSGGATYEVDTSADSIMSRKLMK